MTGFRSVLCATASLLLASAFCAGEADAANSQQSSCHLAPGVKHVVYIQFDNVHLRRDNQFVPSDLQQIPALLNFMVDNGTILANEHDPLISHTADDIITTLTGVYGEKHGQPVANSYGFFKPDGSVGFASSFSYWTDIAPDGMPNMIDQAGKIAPAPWVPFTRAGCDVGAFSIANIEFENVSSDIDNVFGANSPEAAEAKANFDQAVADFEGISIHCAQGSPRCAGGQQDLLPDEPGGYTGFMALFGNKFVAPVVTGTPGNLVVKDLDGVAVEDEDKPPNVGFPGFDPLPQQTLGYLATMLEAGVPVVYGYIEDAHDNHFTGNGAFGPGEAGYVQQLQNFNDAFTKFFARLAADGITKENTIFMFSADENDHFVGKAGAPAGCDGVTTPCTYIRVPPNCDGETVQCTTTNLGEVTIDLRQLLTTEFNDTTVLAVHSDDAPTVYIDGNPTQTATITRTVEQETARLVAFDPVVNSNPLVAQRLAGTTEMGFLHMLTADHNRDPTFTLFGDDDFFIVATSAAKPAPCTSLTACSDEQPSFNWNHGDFQQQIVHTWLSIVGPGVENQGENAAFFTDHADARPTLMMLTGLKDDYAHDGRVVFEALDPKVLPKSLNKNDETLQKLVVAYKAINAPVGTLGRKTLKLSTTGLSGDDATFASVDAEIATLTTTRNAIAGQIIDMLEAAEFNNTPINKAAAEALIDQANALLASVK